MASSRQEWTSPIFFSRQCTHTLTEFLDFISAANLSVLMNGYLLYKMFANLRVDEDSKHPAYCGFLDSRIYISLHCVSLSGASWSIDNQVAVFAFEKSVAKLMTTVLEDLTLLSLAIVDMLEIVVFEAVCEVCTS